MTTTSTSDLCVIWRSYVASHDSRSYILKGGKHYMENVQ